MLPEFAKCVPKSASQRVRCRGHLLVTKILDFGLIWGAFWLRKSTFADVSLPGQPSSMPEGPEVLDPCNCHTFEGLQGGGLEPPIAGDVACGSTLGVLFIQGERL